MRRAGGGVSGESGERLVEAVAAGRDFSGRRVLGPVDLTVAPGETVAIVGPNGAGKTTLVRLLTGLLPPSCGAVRWGGAGAAELGHRELARRIAYVPQVRPTTVPLTVEQLVLLGRHPHLGRWQLAPTAEDRAVVGRALDLAGLTPLAKRRLESLSGGERQTVYIAAALAQEAPLLVLDEPTTHLDLAHQKQVADLILRLRAEAGRTVVTATHDLPLAAHVAERVVALKSGRLAAAGPPRRVFTREVLEELFDAPFDIVRGGDRPVVLMDYSGEPGGALRP